MPLKRDSLFMRNERTGLAGVLLPANLSVSLRLVVFALALAALAFLVQALIWFSEVTLETSPPPIESVYVLCGVAIVGAAVNGYANDDIVVSVCLAVGPLVGFGLFSGAIFVLDMSPVVSETGEVAISLGRQTAVAGSLLGLVGFGVRRLLDRLRAFPSSE